MNDKILYYAHLADEKARQVTQSYQSWTTFLDTVGRLYKYPYYEQLMIAAQRPDATACASYELWNARMQRYVKRGSRGIALIDTSGEEPAIKYVFDISDTGTRPNSRRPYVWQYQEELETVVLSALQQSYVASPSADLPDTLEEVSKNLTDVYWEENRQDILGIVDGSFLDGYDEENIRFAFQEAAAVSTTYAIMSRCGLDPKGRFEHEDFMPVFDFNTPQSIAALGTAISQASEQVLRQIEVTIKTYERQKLAERSSNHDRTDLYPERRLPDPEPAAAADPAETSGQVRQDAKAIPADASPDPLEQHDPVGEPVPPSAGDRRDGEQPSGADDTGSDETERRDRSAESQRPDEMDRADEHPESTGRGDDPPGADLQLSDTAAILRGEQLAMFPTEEEQIA